MIKLYKPNFWDRKNINLISILLSPLTLITLMIIFFKKLFLSSKNYSVPIICVGNIYIGGTSKTPTAIFIANELKNSNIKTVIIRKYYKNHLDEHKLIKEYFSDLILNKNRSSGIYEAINKNFKTIVMDDGMQDYKIKKDLSIACFNSNQLIGNGLVLPSGPLRESLNALKNVHIIIINGERNKNFEKKLININKDLEIYYSYYKPLNIDEFKNKKLLALAAIANPENFFSLLTENNLIIEKKLVYPDHYQFNKDEIKEIIYIAKQKNLKIIMTEKDFFKINNFGLDNINYLKVSLMIKDKENLMNKIKQIYD